MVETDKNERIGPKPRNARFYNKWAWLGNGDDPSKEGLREQGPNMEQCVVRVARWDCPCCPLQPCQQNMP